MDRFRGKFLWRRRGKAGNALLCKYKWTPHILQEGGGFSQTTSAKPWVPLALAAASGADGAFCVGIPSLKGRGGSAAKSKDQKPWWGLQAVIPQPGRSRSPGDLLLLSQPLAPPGLQQAEPGQRLRASPAAHGGTGRRRAQTEQTRLHAALRRQPAPGPSPLPAQQRPVAPPAAGGLLAGSASAAPTASPLGKVPSAQIGAGALGGGPCPGTARTGSAELQWGGGVGGEAPSAPRAWRAEQVPS